MATDAAATSETTSKAEDTASTTPVEPSEGKTESQQQPSKEGEAPKGDEAKTEGETKTALTESNRGAPESYDFKAPEGQTLDEGVINAFAEKAKELDLTNEGAQSILDSVLPKIQQAADEKLSALRTEWIESAKTDEEFGGTAFETNLEVAKKAREKFGSDELNTLLNESGLGDHPAFIRAFFKIGKAISEDTLITGGRPEAEEDIRDKAVQVRRMYPEHQQ